MKKINISILFFFSLLSLSAQVPLSQAECRRMALENNEKISLASNAVEEARLQKQIAFTNYLPKFDGSATALMMEDQEIMGMTLKIKGAYLAGISVSQPLFAGGKIVNGNKLAKIGKECSLEQQRQTRMQVIADADNAYWTYIAVLEKIKMVEAYMAQMDSIYDMVQRMVEAEMGTEYDLTRISAKRSELMYQLQKARNGANLCRMNLCNIIGDSMNADIVPVDTAVLITMIENLEVSIDNRPEMTLMDKQIEAKKLQVKMVRGDFLPTIGVQGGYSYYGNVMVNGASMGPDGNYYPYEMEYKDGIWMLMAGAQIPLFHFGEGVKKIKLAKMEVKDAELSKSQNARLLTIETQQAAQNLKDSYLMIETAALGLRQSEENLSIMRTKFDSEMATLTDLLDAQSQWQQAKSNLIEAKTQYKIYETEYLRTTGRLDD